MLNNQIYPTYLSLDFDLWNYNKGKYIEIIKKLIKNGYKIIKQEGQDFSFFRN